MGRRDGGRKGKRAYTCIEPPCIYVVVDERRKIYKVFVEESDGSIVSIPVEKLRGACRDLAWVLEEGFREADPNETDFLARKYLHATPAEEEEY